LLIEEGYITSEESNEIVIATNNTDEEKSDELATDLQETAENRIVEQKVVANVEAVAVGKERVDEAKAMGVTPGKLNLVEKLKESSETPEDVNLQEWLNKPVKEIQKEIKDNNAKNQNGIDNSKKNNTNKVEEQVKTQETEQVKTQETEQVKTQETEQAKTQETEQAKTQETEQAKTPQADTNGNSSNNKPTTSNSNSTTKKGSSR